VKKIFFLTLFVLLLVPVITSAQSDATMVYYCGANTDGIIYLREDVARLVCKKLGLTIEVGGSYNGYSGMETMKLCFDPTDDFDHPKLPGFYVLDLGHRLKAGKSMILYFKLTEGVWLPSAAENYELFPDDCLVDNGQSGKEKSVNLKIIVNDQMSFNPPTSQ